MTSLIGKFLLVIFISYFATPVVVNAAAQVPITQEEIEAILERDQVNDLSSTSLPTDLKRRLGQTIASTTDSLKPVITDTAQRAGQAVATATNKISSTSDKIKGNLENYKNQAQSDLSDTLLGGIYQALAAIWKSISSWVSGLFGRS